MSKKTKMKESKQTVRETEQKDVETVQDELLKESQKYLKHRFQIENDKHHRENVLNQNQGTISLMDFSKNVSGSPKYVPQDAHFSNFHSTAL